MTLDFFDTPKAFSPITYALLQDMGWYDVDNSFSDTTNFGFKKGCDFVQNVCYSSTAYPEFCSNADTSQGCTTQHFSKGSCKTNIFSDNCLIWANSFFCVD
jgi:hypothetical protein